MIKRFTLILFLCIVSNIVFAQKFSVYLGDKQFNQFNYLKAVDYYEHALEKDSSNVHVLRRLAQSHHKIGDNITSLKFYELLLDDSKHEASDWLLHADLLRDNGEYTLAKNSYQNYLKANPENNDVQSLVKEMELLEKVSLPELNCEIQTVPLNSTYSDFAPVFFKNNLVFSSARKIKRFRSERYGWNGQFFLELFQFNKDEVSENQVERFAKGTGSKYHEGVVCFSPDYKKMFFTRSNYYHGKLKRDEEGVNNLKIFIAEDINDKWKIIEEFPYNSDDYSVGHPSLSQDGKILYFVSDMPGGHGGTDLYRSFYKDGKWTKPENLGSGINTSENEMFPHINHNTLFFASNGRAGKGGLDIYVTNLHANNAVIKHLGAPINSPEDDFALVMHPKASKGYFSSNRKGGQGDDDVYAFEISSKNDVEIQIQNSETKQLITADELLVDGKTDADFNLDIESLTYSKEILRGQNYKLHISKEGFSAKDTSLYSGLYDAKQKHIYELTPLPVVEEIVETLPDSIPSIYFDLDEYFITEEAKEILTQVSDLFTKHQVVSINLYAYTDVRARISYNEKLAQNRAVSTKDMLIGMGIPEECIFINVLGEKSPLLRPEGQLEEEWHRLNRRVDFELCN